MIDKHELQEYFNRLGLSADLAEVYSALCEHGPLSLMQLSIKAKVDRTRLYRLLNKLKEAHLIEVQEDYKRNLYRAAPFANLHIMLADRQEELVKLEAELQILQHKVYLKGNDRQPTRVQFYRGESGVKQMLWNQTRCTEKESLSILFTNMQVHTKEAFFERWVQRCNERDLTFRSIAGDYFLRSQREWYGKYRNERLAHWEGRHVPRSVFEISHSIVIYDDVVVYYNWKDGEVFGSETYNKEIADTQRQFFEMLWQLGQPIPSYGLEKSGD